MAGRKHRQDLRQPPHRDNPLQRPVATRFGKLPRIDQDVGLPGRDHPLGALRERDVVVVPIGKSDAGDPPRARRDTDRASDRGAQDTCSMPAQNVGWRGRRCGRIEPGSIAAAKILTELFMGGARPRVDDSYDAAVAIQSLSPADGPQRPRYGIEVRHVRAHDSERGSCGRRLLADRRNIGGCGERANPRGRGTHDEAIDDDETFVLRDVYTASQAIALVVEPALTSTYYHVAGRGESR